MDLSNEIEFQFIQIYFSLSAKMEDEDDLQLVIDLKENSEPPAGWQNPHQLQPRYLRVSRAEEVRRKKLAEQERS